MTARPVGDLRSAGDSRPVVVLTNKGNITRILTGVKHAGQTLFSRAVFEQTVRCNPCVSEDVRFVAAPKHTHVIRCEALKRLLALGKISSS